jgi:chitodextrinase
MGSRSKTVVVGTSGDPAAGLRLLADDPGIGDQIVFNGASSTAVSPRTIVSYDWQFGTGRSGSGMIVSKKYDTPGTYNVTLTVTDDAGNKGTSSQGVTVGTSSAGGLTAAFTFSPSGPTAGSSVNFNASTSTSADPIASYKWGLRRWHHHHQLLAERCAHVRDGWGLHCDADRDGLEVAHGQHVEYRDSELAQLP